MRKRGLCYCQVSVRLSVTFVDCIQTAEDIVKLLSRQQGRKIHGVGKFCDFRLETPFTSETVRDRPTVAMEH